MRKKFLKSLKLVKKARFKKFLKQCANAVIKKRVKKKRPKQRELKK